MPVGGKLKLKGESKVISKKKKKKKTEKKEDTKVKGIDPTSVSVQSGKTYEEEFDIETKRANESKPRSTAWGISYAKPPKILHGYNREVKGDTAEERLDLRCAKRTDKFCK
eukprot:g9059.t1